MANKKIGLWIFIIVLIPLLMWLFTQPINGRFFDSLTTLTSIGQILGITGITLLSLTFLLSARLKFLENYFNGLDKLYIYHRNTSIIGFMIILFHPIFLALTRALTSFSSAAKFLIPGENIAINFGIFALTTLIILVVLTLFVRLKYNRWKVTHKFMGLFLLFAVIHVLLIKSDVSQNISLKIYLVSLAFVALFVYTYRVIFGKSFTKRFKYKVDHVKNLSNNIVEITLKPINNKIGFKPGQFVFVSFLNNKILKEQHPFTISSSPKEDVLRLSIKNSGDYTSKLNKLVKEEVAEVEGPYGRFFKESSRDEIWIAGGIGITPFLSKIRNNLDDKRYYLFYSVRDKDEELIIKELDEISKSKKNFNLYINRSSEGTHIDINKIKNEVNNVNDKEVYLCGPLKMMDAFIEQFKKEGLSKRFIHWEEFSLR